MVEQLIPDYSDDDITHADQENWYMYWIRYLVYYHEMERQYGNLELYFQDPNIISIDQFYKGNYYV
jgi:hypothetical protein